MGSRRQFCEQRQLCMAAPRTRTLRATQDLCVIKHAGAQRFIAPLRSCTIWPTFSAH